jgi:hypothetical protein
MEKECRSSRGVGWMKKGEGRVDEMDEEGRGESR